MKAERSEDDTKALVKTTMVRLMFAKGHGKEEIRALFEFVEWSVRISDVEKAMKYVSEIRTIADKEGEEMTFLGDFAKGIIAQKEEKAEKVLLEMKKEHEKALLMVEEHEKARREVERECAEYRRLAEELKEEAEKARREERQKAENARLELEQTLLSQAEEMLDAGEPEEKVRRFVKLPTEIIDDLIASRRG